MRTKKTFIKKSINASRLRGLAVGLKQEEKAIGVGCGVRRGEANILEGGRGRNDGAGAARRGGAGSGQTQNYRKGMGMKCGSNWVRRKRDRTEFSALT